MPTRSTAIVSSVLLFLLVYVVLFVAMALIVQPTGAIQFQWSALVAAIVANLVANYIYDRNDFRYGLLIPPGRLLANVIGGVGMAAMLVGSGDLLITTLTGTRRVIGTGFPFLSSLILFTPAVLHEELLFRGYAFQKLAERNIGVALASSSVIFAALHLGNEHVGALALFNILLAGILLGAFYLVTRSLWFPIAAHWFWNIFSGPILGHEVSGYEEGSVFLTVDAGNPLLTGGEFGIEGSVLMTVVEIAALALLYRKRSLLRSRVVASS